MGFLHMVVISNAEAAREVLQVQDNIFSNRPATIAIRYLTYDRADMAFAHYGPFWRQMRKICVVKLFSRKRAESWNSVRGEVDTIVRTIAANVGDPINVGEVVYYLTKNIVYRAALGSGCRERQAEFISILEEFSKLFEAFNIADFIPCLWWVDPQHLNKRLIKARAALDGFIDKIIDEHVEKRRRDICEGESDMVDGLLNFYSEEAKLNNDSVEQQNAMRVTKDNIKAVIMDVMFGGTETVASGIEWTMAELMRSPEELRREMLRLHPPIPLLLHETAENAAVCGYHVPKGARVIINVWAIGRDKGTWEEPEAFKPLRFLNPEAPNFEGSDFEFIPFGSGRRSCPGMQLGLYGLEVAVAHLLHSFTWELPNGMKPSELDTSDVFGLAAPRASRLVAIPTKRLMCPL
ncbi:unnamed protein product [Sphenostylis stenocarpa]|uniref:Uncharacterized protein n=1 Tax=Sphenostylis stenocarpa TaxID=92480 RepID=A0AA86SK85_9FABA|nr:unnamed protein product [Sphenostylis stenocarpa]